MVVEILQSISLQTIKREHDVLWIKKQRFCVHVALVQIYTRGMCAQVSCAVSVRFFIYKHTQTQRTHTHSQTHTPPHTHKHTHNHTHKQNNSNCPSELFWIGHTWIQYALRHRPTAPTYLNQDTTPVELVITTIRPLNKCSRKSTYWNIITSILTVLRFQTDTKQAGGYWECCRQWCTWCVNLQRHDMTNPMMQFRASANKAWNANVTDKLGGSEWLTYKSEVFTIKRKKVRNPSTESDRKETLSENNEKPHLLTFQ